LASKTTPWPFTATTVKAQDAVLALALNLHPNLNILVRRELLARHLEHRFGVIVAVAVSGRHLDIREKPGFAPFQRGLQPSNDIAVTVQIGKRFAPAAGVEQSCRGRR
jgi:hypothetical protein